MPKKSQATNITISTSTILKIAGIAAVLYLLFLIRDIVIILLASLIFASALDPWVDRLHRNGWPRAISLSIFYIIFLFIIGATVYLIIPPIITETSELANNLPVYLSQADNWLGKFNVKFDSSDLIKSLESQLGNLSGNLKAAADGVVSVASNLFGALAAFFLLLVITFYMAVEEKSTSEIISHLVPGKQQKRVLAIAKKAQDKIGYWFSGQLFLCFVIFLMTYLSLSILGVKYALVLAIIAGLTEAIPYLGPILAAVPGVFLAFVQSPILAVFVAAMYLVIQQIENNVLVPVVMRQAVGLNPIISITVLMVGFQLGGILGAILAIPTATAISVVIQDFNQSKYKKS